MTKKEQERLDRQHLWLKAIARSKKNTREDLLAIDPATMCGWACSSGDYGVLDLNRKKHESDGMKWLRFKRTLADMITSRSVKVLAYEAPSGTHINAVIHHAKLVAIIETVCEELNIECKGYNVKSIKAFATNNGNANKELMIKHATKLFGYIGNNDNEADAVCILNYLKSEI